MGFHIAVSLVDSDVLGHFLLRVETDAGITGLARRVFRELHQVAAIAFALRLRSHRNIVQQQAVGLRNQDQHTLHGIAHPQHMDHALCDAGSVIIEHRPGRRADARDIVAVGLRDDLLNVGQVVEGG